VGGYQHWRCVYCTVESVYRNITKMSMMIYLNPHSKRVWSMPSQRADERQTFRRCGSLLPCASVLMGELALLVLSIKASLSVEYTGFY
jgi:hypothetical protein